MFPFGFHRLAMPRPRRAVSTVPRAFDTAKEGSMTRTTTGPAILAAVAVITSCAHVQRTNLPDGRSGFVI
jgi:hypothetical protein